MLRPQTPQMITSVVSDDTNSATAKHASYYEARFRDIFNNTQFGSPYWTSIRCSLDPTDSAAKAMIRDLDNAIKGST